MTDTTTATVTAMLDGVTPGRAEILRYWFDDVETKDFDVFVAQHDNGDGVVIASQLAAGDASFLAWARDAVPALAAERDAAIARAEAAEARLAELEAAKDGAYLERNKLVLLLASMFPSGIKRTAIPGWYDDWHGCVYIDFPWGQASWHYHDSQAYLFAHLSPYLGEWDGHSTEAKYAAILTAAKGGR